MRVEATYGRGSEWQDWVGRGRAAFTFCRCGHTGTRLLRRDPHSTLHFLGGKPVIYPQTLRNTADSKQIERLGLQHETLSHFGTIVAQTLLTSWIHYG